MTPTLLLVPVSYLPTARYLERRVETGQLKREGGPLYLGSAKIERFQGTKIRLVVRSVDAVSSPFDAVIWFTSGITSPAK